MTTITPQTFIAPGGEEMVILTRAEYDALCDLAADAEEDAADASVYAVRKAALERGDDTVLPAEVSAAIHRGASRLKAIRKWRGKSQVEVAEALGIAQSYLSALEGGDRRMTEDLVDKFATEFDVPKAWVAS
ncbi:helix-turn-helix domain-containing protein [Devosia sp.]|uniref:helix-turn-helix domain-containing protein n=1 Tax=Devosia sp. TaxID=1871048 RepID=UPI003BAD23E2